MITIPWRCKVHISITCTLCQMSMYYSLFITLFSITSYVGAHVLAIIFACIVVSIYIYVCVYMTVNVTGYILHLMNYRCAIGAAMRLLIVTFD